MSFSVPIFQHKHHKDKVNRVGFNQDLNFKLGIQTDLTEFRTLDKESVKTVENVLECRQLHPQLDFSLNA